MSPIRAYLQLVRFPAVFSAMADILVGILLVQGTLRVDGCLLPLALLLTASCGLYLAGMAFNDIFDRKIDAQERPNRPIPSGRVSLRSAVVLGTVLVVVGLAAAAFAGRVTLLVAGMLVAAIFLYDGVLKSTVIGPINMGLCRSFNVLLGASVAGSYAVLLQPPAVTVAACYGVYITGLTWFARNEAGRSRRGPLIAATAVINAGLVGLIGLAVLEDYGLAGRAPRVNVLFAFAVVAAVVNRGLLLAISEPSAARVQRAVKTMLQWLVVLDAVLVFAASGNAVYAVVTASLMIPAVLLGRWIYVT